MMQKHMNLRIMLVFLMVICIGTIFADNKILKNSNVSKKNHTEKKKEYLLKKLPQDAENVEVEGNKYFRHNGIYYRPGKSGYHVVNAPHGLKVKHLPRGVRVIRHYDVDYYFYYNTYYRYDPINTVYIVIDAPDWADNDFYDDKLNLMNGSVLVGKYLGGDRDEIYFIFSGEKKRFPVEEVISIEFAPPIYDGDDF